MDYNVRDYNASGYSSYATCGGVSDDDDDDDDEYSGYFGISEEQHRILENMHDHSFAYDSELDGKSD